MHARGSFLLWKHLRTEWRFNFLLIFALRRAKDGPAVTRNWQKSADGQSDHSTAVPIPRLWTENTQRHSMREWKPSIHYTRWSFFKQGLNIQGNAILRAFFRFFFGEHSCRKIFYSSGSDLSSFRKSFLFSLFRNYVIVFSRRLCQGLCFMWNNRQEQQEQQ